MTKIVCPICGEESETVKRRHRNTMYVTDDELNYSTSCQTCVDEGWHNFQELWDDIYSDIRASIAAAIRDSHNYYQE